MRLLVDGEYSIEDEISIPGEGISPLVFCAGWLLEIIDIGSGEYSFLRDGEKVRTGSDRIGAYYPPFTVIQTYVRSLKGRVTGVGSIKMLDGLPSKPVVFETNFAEEFTSAYQAVDVISSATNIQSIELNTNPSLLSIRAKRLIDDNYLIYPSIARIASKLKVSHEHMSRQFKRDYKMSPSKYLHQLRYADATYKLSLGEEIVDVSYDVGYNDLSRFYKQFRKSAKMSPATCRSILLSREIKANIKKRQDGRRLAN